MKRREDEGRWAGQELRKRINGGCRKKRMRKNRKELRDGRREEGEEEP